MTKGVGGEPSQVVAEHVWSYVWKHVHVHVHVHVRVHVHVHVVWVWETEL